MYITTLARVNGVGLGDFRSSVWTIEDDLLITLEGATAAADVTADGTAATGGVSARADARCRGGVDGGVPAR